MPPKSIPSTRIAAVLAAASGLVLTLGACSPPPTPSAGPTSQALPGLPSAHVHGLSVNSETNQMLLATHEGLFDLSETPVVKIGPANDLMGFTAAADQGVFYASGHPGNDSALPNPLGLIKSTDGGRTWEQLSRQNESDFHALTVAKSGIVAFDEVLRTSADGKTWKTVDADFNPAVLAAYPTSDIVLATVRNGVRRSTDGGTTWTVSTSAPVLRFAAFANAEEVIGIEPDGAVHYSPDAGTTWSAKGRVNDEVIAVAATSGKDGKPWIWAATPAGIVVSTDTGAIFRPVEDAS